MTDKKTIICTICCREKDTAKEDLPAIRRYKSKRITAAADLARKSGLPFSILSGKYGLIDGNKPIPYYDKLMGVDDLGEIIDLNIKYLENNKIGKIIFICPDPGTDHHVHPYLRSIQAAARGTGCELETIFVPPFPGDLPNNPSC